MTFQIKFGTKVEAKTYLHIAWFFHNSFVVKLNKNKNNTNLHLSIFFMLAYLDMSRMWRRNKLTLTQFHGYPVTYLFRNTIRLSNGLDQDQNHNCRSCSRSKLFAKVISRWQKSLLARKELKLQCTSKSFGSWDITASFPYENSRRNPPGIQAVSKRKGHGFEKILA